MNYKIDKVNMQMYKYKNLKCEAILRFCYYGGILNGFVYNGISYFTELQMDMG